jgi:hypothetical protein
MLSADDKAELGRALSEAASMGDKEAVTTLLDRGADINAKAGVGPSSLPGFTCPSEFLRQT